MTRTYCILKRQPGLDFDDVVFKTFTDEDAALKHRNKAPSLPSLRYVSVAGRVRVGSRVDWKIEKRPL